MADCLWKWSTDPWACFCEPNLHSPGATLGIQLDLWSSCSLSLTLGNSIQETNCIFCQIWEDAGRELLNTYLKKTQTVKPSRSNSLLLLLNEEYLITDLAGCGLTTVHLYLHIDRTLNLVIPQYLVTPAAVGLCVLLFWQQRKECDRSEQYHGTFEMCTVYVMYMCTKCSCEGHRLCASFPERSKWNIILILWIRISNSFVTTRLVELHALCMETPLLEQTFWGWVCCLVSTG